MGNMYTTMLDNACQSDASLLYLEALQPVGLFVLMRGIFKKQGILLYNKERGFYGLGYASGNYRRRGAQSG
jgi:hypothetical protein